MDEINFQKDPPPNQGLPYQKPTLELIQIDLSTKGKYSIFEDEDTLKNMYGPS